MKNSASTLVRPNVPSGKKIDTKLLLKSIAPSGCVYLRLLRELETSSDVSLDNEMMNEKPANIEYENIVVLSTLNASGSVGGDHVAANTSTINPSDAVSVSSIMETNVTSNITSVSPRELPALSTVKKKPFQCSFDIQSIINRAKKTVSY